ncbi:Cas4 family exonuclease [Microbacterium phage Fizzles]|nr:Cas4 family exonuclease [Microbacterium phage Fizzles]
MAAENIAQAEILRDTELEQRLLEAVIADRNAQPRSQQLQIGPSEVGGCRELLRAGLFEPPTEAEPETNWAAAAHVGQVMGADLERIFGERVGALLQQRYTTMFGMFGISISGGADLTFLDGDQISDLKSIDDMGSTLYDLKRDAAAIETLLSIYREGLLFAKNIETADGGYELTAAVLDKVAKLSNYIQIAIYVMGAMQAGIVSENGSGRLVFYDRSGNYQGFVVAVIPTEWVWMFYTIGQMRIGQVVQTQSAYEATGGNPAVLATLRDKAPSFCFSPKVMCPRRMHCWAGSEWTANNQITDPEQVAAMDRYDVARDLAKVADGMKRAAKAALDGVTGVAPDGKMLTWTRSGAINLVQTTVTEPKTQAVLDQFLPPVDVQAEVEREHAIAALAVQAEAPALVADLPALEAAAPSLAEERPQVGYQPDPADPDEQQTIREQEAISASLARPTRADRYKALAKTGAPVVRRMAHEITGIELKGLRKEDAIDAILKHEYPETGPVAEAAGSPEPAVTNSGESAFLALAQSELAVDEQRRDQLIEQAMQGGPAGDEAADIYRDEYPGDAGDDLAAQNGPEFYAPAEHSERAVAQQEVDDAAAEAEAARAASEFAARQQTSGLGRVAFENSDGSPRTAEQEAEEDAQAEARRRLMHGPHVAPLLDKPAPPAPSTEPILLPDGSVYVPLEGEDPARPGLFFDGMGNRDKLRQMQYDSDASFRERCLAVRQKFAGNTPASRQP